MVQIHGTIGPLKKVLSACPEELNIQAFRDIKAMLQEQKKVLTKEKQKFKRGLSKRLKKEESSLQHLQFEKGIIEDTWDERIKVVSDTIQQKKSQIKDDHRYQLLLTLPAHYSNTFVMKYIQKPSEMKKEKQKIQQQKGLVTLLRDDPETVFRGEKSKLVGTITSLEQLMKSPEYTSCVAELEVLNELGKLNDTFHVYCDLQLSLDKYITYRGDSNVRTAAIDMLVVGPTGIFVITVNNAGSESSIARANYTDCEQVDRAGVVLYAYLKRRCYSLNPGITKVLVASQDTLDFNPLFKSVLVRRVSNLNALIMFNKHSLSPAQVQEIHSILS